MLRRYGPDLELALNESQARLEAFPREHLEHDDEAMRALDSGRCPLLLRPWSLPPNAARAPGARRMTQGQEATLGCVCLSKGEDSNSKSKAYSTQCCARHVLLLLLISVCV